MEMQITSEWLRNKTKTEPDIEIEAGIPTHLLQSIDAFLPADVVPVDAEDKKRTVH